tara:strand:- start:5946 stop:6587 length:642 start_codon:yes stop_codon:yes gene_type:complete
MITKTKYWCFQEALPSHICDSIIRYSLTKKDSYGTTGRQGNFKNLKSKDQKELLELRNSKLVWLDEQWIYRYVMPFVHKANINAGWNFQIDVSEQCQFTKYGEGQFYDWHCDSFPEPYGFKESGYLKDHKFNGKIRKLSVTVSLSDPETYRGGELEFCLSESPVKRLEIEQCKDVLPKGSIVVFPSFVWHRVKPVTSGTRYSLVIWNCGNPYQ